MAHTTEWIEGNAPGISAARLNEPFHVRLAEFDAPNNRVNTTIGPGRVSFLGGTVVERLVDTEHFIGTPVINTTYHVYIHENNTFSHNTTGVAPTGAIRLGTVRTGAALGNPTTRVDMRGQLVGESVTGTITIDPALVPTSNVGGLRAILGWLANRIRAITGATNWWDVPATTLVVANTHHVAVAPIHGSTAAPTASTIMQRDASGRAQVVAPLAAADIARLDTVTTHEAATTVHSAASIATPSRLILRDVAGRAQVIDGNAPADISTRRQLLLQSLI